MLGVAQFQLSTSDPVRSTWNAIEIEGSQQAILPGHDDHGAPWHCGIDVKKSGVHMKVMLKTLEDVTL